MKKRLGVALGLLLLAAALLRADEAAPVKWDLAGRWKPVALETQGAPDEVPDETWVFDQGVLTIHRHAYRHVTQLTYREKPDAAPKQFDWSRPRKAADPAREPDLGIYRFKEGKLQLCYSSTRGVRPTEFKTRAAKGPQEPSAILYTLERVVK